MLRSRSGCLLRLLLRHQFARWKHAKLNFLEEFQGSKSHLTPWDEKGKEEEDLREKEHIRRSLQDTSSLAPYLQAGT